jgi:hypothetical protein
MGSSRATLRECKECTKPNAIDCKIGVFVRMVSGSFVCISAISEQYVAWNLAIAPTVSPQTTLSRADLIKF